MTVQSSLAEAFTNDIVLLKSLHIEQDVRQLIETQRLMDAFKLVVHQLNTLETTLVVLDNANNFEDLIAYKSLFANAGFTFEELQTMIETKFIHDETLNEEIGRAHV